MATSRSELKMLSPKKIMKARKNLKISLFRLFEEKWLQTKHNYKAKIKLEK